MSILLCTRLEEFLSAGPPTQDQNSSTTRRTQKAICGRMKSETVEACDQGSDAGKEPDLDAIGRIGPDDRCKPNGSGTL